MKYIVMECGLSYAVVLDEEGRFLKVPNLGYTVGDRVENVILFEELPSAKQKKPFFLRYGAAVACLTLMLLGGWRFWADPVGTVRIHINPDVQLTVNRFDRVVKLEGLNPDGTALIAGYNPYGQTVRQVSDALADRAVQQGFLANNGRVALVVDSAQESRKLKLEQALLQELENHLEEAIEVISIPITEAPAIGESWDDWDDLWDDDDDGDSHYGASDYGETNYGGNLPVSDPPAVQPPVTPPEAQDTDYDGVDTDYEPVTPYEEGVTDYDDREVTPYDPPEVNDSPYDDPKDDEGDSNYDPPDPASDYDDRQEKDSNYEEQDRPDKGSDYDDRDDD